MGLTKDRKTYSAIQTFSPKEGHCNLEAGGPYRGSLLRCVVAGNITYNWDSEETDTIECLVGDDYAIPRNATVTIVSGTFHIS